MDMFVIMKAKNKEGFYFELNRMPEENWENIKNSAAMNRTVYASPDLFDETIKSYNFKEIVWNKLYNQYNHTYMKVKVPLSENFIEMEKNAEKTAEKIMETLDNIRAEQREAHNARKERIYQEKIKPLQEKSKIIIAEKNKEYEGLSEREALMKWKNEDECQHPCANIITSLKKKSGMSWEEFAEYVRESF